MQDSKLIRFLITIGGIKVQRQAGVYSTKLRLWHPIIILILAIFIPFCIFQSIPEYYRDFVFFLKEMYGGLTKQFLVKNEDSLKPWLDKKFKDKK